MQKQNIFFFAYIVDKMYRKTREYYRNFLQ